MTSALAGTLPTVLRDPPLDPSGDEARNALRRELIRPEYNDRDPVQLLLDWVEGLIDDTVTAASGAPTVAVAVTIMVALALLTVTMLLVSRTHRSARADASAPAVLGDEAISADAWRRRAEQALAAGDAAGALVDGFRALAVRQIEQDRIDDVPQATARELARALASAFPDHADDLGASAGVFDEVLYGDHPATTDQARRMLDLDDQVTGRLTGRRDRP